MVLSYLLARKMVQALNLQMQLLVIKCNCSTQCNKMLEIIINHLTWKKKQLFLLVKCQSIIGYQSISAHQITYLARSLKVKVEVTDGYFQLLLSFCITSSSIWENGRQIYQHTFAKQLSALGLPEAKLINAAKVALKSKNFLPETGLFRIFFQISSF